MDQDTRSEIDKLHERISDLKQRVTVLETDLPYIRKGVEKIENSMSWALRIAIGAIILAVIKFAMDGGFTVASKAAQVMGGF